jgi:hypothetical protein
MDFDAFLNMVIPWVIGIVGFWIMYKPLKEPLSGLFSWIGSMFSGIFGMFKDKTEDISINNPKEIYYE